jgi:hypothetical protein
VVVCAAQIEGRLLKELEWLAHERESIAEINRKIGGRAEALGLVRPSYARVRQIVHDVRGRLESVPSVPSVPSWRGVHLDLRLRGGLRWISSRGR